MKITPAQWIKLVQLISTFIIGVITALTVQSCTASMSVFLEKLQFKTGFSTNYPAKGRFSNY